MKKNIYFKRAWYDMLKYAPEEISFCFLKYIFEGEETIFKERDLNVFFSIVKSHFDDSEKEKDKDFLYIIKCTDENEVFYKYGTTNHSDLSKRFSFYTSSMPYLYEIVLHKEKNLKFNPVIKEKELKSSQNQTDIFLKLNLAVTPSVLVKNCFLMY